MRVAVPPIQPLVCKAHLVIVKHRVRHRLRWMLMHTALLIFFADVLGELFPSFGDSWKQVSKGGVAVAAFIALLAEYLVDANEKA